MYLIVVAIVATSDDHAREQLYEAFAVLPYFLSGSGFVFPKGVTESSSDVHAASNRPGHGAMDACAATNDNPRNHSNAVCDSW